MTMASYSMLIAESGSTKTEWVVGRDGKVIKSFRSPGINPNVMTKESIEDTFRMAFEDQFQDGEIQEVIFYGAGLGHHSQRDIVADVLRKVLPSAHIVVDHDMVAAVRSTGREEGIVCILGTGSNSCLFRDRHEVLVLGGHGWIMGDEGSGKDLGHHLIKGLLQGDFPDEVREYVEGKEGDSIFEIKISIHKSEKPNVRMASLARYVKDMIHIPEVRMMVVHRFLAFLDTTVCRYPDYRQLHIDVIGSIGYHFREQLEEACRVREVQLGHLIPEPIHNLLSYHFSQLS